MKKHQNKIENSAPMGKNAENFFKLEKTQKKNPKVESSFENRNSSTLQNNKKTIVLTGGGTAGHVYPALAVAEKLQNFDLHYIGGNGIEKEILSKHKNITYHEISGVKLQRKLTLKNLLIPFKLYKAIKEAKKVLKEISPDLIFSKGGFVAVPVAIAAKKMKLPLISHESDLSFGLANKIILRYANVMCTSFTPTGKGNPKCIHSGQPIRQNIFTGKKLSFFSNDNPCLLVLGGSLGAQFLNDIIFQNLDELSKHFNILHICGKKNFKDITHNGYKIFPFVENIEDFYATADIVISRAGSGVINELLALSKPMFLIPLSKKCSRGDQIENAKLFCDLGYAQMMEEEEYNFQTLCKQLEILLKNSKKIKENMKKTAKNNAVEKIVEIIKENI